MSLLTSAAVRVASRFLSGANVTVLPGTAIGFRFDSTIGFDFWEGSTFTSEGTPTRPISYAPVSLVQEGPFPPLASWAMPGYLISFLPDYWPNEAEDPPPVINFRFSNSSLNSGLSHHFLAGQPLWFFQGLDTGWTICSAAYLNLRDCQFNSGWWSLGEPSSRSIYPAAWGGPVIPGAVSLFNNSFNRVAMSLDPDTGPVYWEGPYEDVTMNVRLTATNNTFRGGWLFIEQVPATDETEEDWVFKYNLCDKVAFAQQPDRPLHFDYNAYWPCRPANDPDPELHPGQTPRLSPASAHDFDLTLAPPYRIGPLGSFYIDSGSELEDATDITAAELGLWHYTTRDLDQQKDGALGTGVLDIGVHYVALDLATGLPKDSDSPTADGIPDYVEDADGDGEWDQGVETKINGDHTDTGVHDSLNAIYDDVDLDGDCLVGRIEKALSICSSNPLDPLVPHNPLTLTQVVTPQEPGIIRLSVPLNRDLLSGKGAVRLYVNGVSAKLQRCDADQNGNCLFVWNSTYERPGDQVLSAVFTLREVPPEARTRTVAGVIQPFHSENMMQFFIHGSIFDETGAILYGQLPHLNASYTIRVYDPETPEIPMKTISGSTSTGVIEERWVGLIKDTDGMAFTGNAMRAEFQLEGSSWWDMQWINRGEMEVKDGKFVVSFMNEHDDLTQRNYGAMWLHMQHIVDVLMLQQNPGFYDHTFINNPTSPTGGGVKEPGFIDSRAKAIALRDALADRSVRNFFSTSHGSAEVITNKRGAADVYLTSEEVRDALNSYDPLLGFYFKHRYRLVIMNGCGIGSDRDWPLAFGIGDIVLPQAFVGFIEEVAVATTAATWNDAPEGEPRKGYGTMWTEFFANWRGGMPLRRCIETACNPSEYKWPLPITFNADIYKGTVRTSRIALYGNEWLTREGVYTP